MRKNFWLVFFGLVLLGGAVAASYWPKKKKLAVPPPSSEEQGVGNSCQQDGDCVLALSKKEACCRCPQAISKKILKSSSDWEEYVAGQQKEVEKECQEIACAPCQFFEGPFCQAGKCQGKTGVEEEFCQDESTGVQMSYAEAREVASKSDVCIERGIPLEGKIGIDHFCDGRAGSWSLALESKKPVLDCLAYCEVNISTRGTKVIQACADK